METLPLGLAQSAPANSAARRNSHCWSNLPLDLMQLVFERLGFADFKRAKSVCSSWRSGSRQSQPDNQIPWMIIFPKDENHCLLFNPEEKEKLYKTRNFGNYFAKSSCVASHRSWLLMLYRDYCEGKIKNPSEFKLYILHLLTGERINLPTLESEFGLTVQILWIDEKTKDYLVIIVKRFNEEDTFSFKKGDNSWKQMPQLSLSDCNMLYKDHKLYCLNANKLKVFDFSGEIPLLVSEISVRGCIQRASGPCRMRHAGIPRQDQRSYSLKNVVVILSGDVLIVNSFRPIFSKIWNFRVYKLKGNKKWEKIVSLGDEAILLDLGITVPAKNIHGVKKNCIYFNGLVSEYPYDENFVFNLDTNKIENPHQIVSSAIPFSNARWFLPSFKP